LRRRIPLSLTLFTALVVVDMFVLGVRPRSLWNWHDAGTVAGELLVVIGLAIRSWAAGTLVKTTSLIVAGPYALVRNPLYVGSFLMMFGFCLLVHDWQSIWFIVGPVAALYWLQVRQEEARLAACFADQWPAYAATTPRFVPRRWTSQALRGWSVNNWVRNREYQAVWATAVALAGLAAWRLLS
jgi:protein-S-isoprenylcysteine O-methyltransferase Ste14